MLKEDVYCEKAEYAQALLNEVQRTADLRRPEVNAILQLLFTKGIHIAGSFTLDAIEQLPEFAQVKGLERPLPFAVEGKIIDTWELSKSKSPDGAVYKLLNLLPHKCRSGSLGEIILCQEFPRSERTTALLLHSTPLLVRNDLPFAELTDGALLPKPEESFEFYLEIFDKLAPEAQNDFERLQIIFTFLRRDHHADQAKYLLDEYYLPERKAMFEQIYKLRVGEHTPPLKAYSAAPTEPLQ